MQRMTLCISLPMKKNILTFAGFSLLFFSLALPAVSFSGSFPVPQDVHCDECGMSLDRNSKFISEVITQDNKKLFFCDIGDMLFHFRNQKEIVKAAYVRDYATGTWIDAGTASYVLDKKFATPMSWGIAAFAEESAARKLGSPVDYHGAFGLLK
jgi:nitrous oxide reductase accessory protein NosL